MDSLTAWYNALPPMSDFAPPTPEAYAVLLSGFQYFPVFTLVQWLTPFQPQGKTSISTRFLNFPGRYAWCIMESFGAINMIYTLVFHNNDASWPLTAATFSNAAFSSLPRWNQLLATLYVIHYINRAFITPLFMAPSMSPIHAIIMCSAATFNYVNSSCLAGWLLGYGSTPKGIKIAPSPPSGIAEAAPYIPYVGLALYVLGMYGNIRSENTLFRLRKEEAHRRASSNKGNKGTDTNNKGENIYSKVYVIPPATGYFRFVLFPHYSLEWLQWFGFALMGFGVYTASPGAAAASGSSASVVQAGPIPLAPYYVPVANLLLNEWGLSFPFPAIVFFVNVVATTMARASWGRKWYQERFGEKAVAGRTAAVPYLV